MGHQRSLLICMAVRAQSMSLPGLLTASKSLLWVTQVSKAVVMVNRERWLLNPAAQSLQTSNSIKKWICDPVSEGKNKNEKRILAIAGFFALKCSYIFLKEVFEHRLLHVLVAQLAKPKAWYRFHKPKYLQISMMVLIVKTNKKACLPLRHYFSWLKSCCHNIPLVF